MIQSSILRQRAAEAGIPNLDGTPPDSLLAVYEQTLRDMSTFLDTTDLRKLRSNALENMANDLLQIIGGLRKLRSSEARGNIRSLDGLLDSLRTARDQLFVAQDLSDSEEPDPDKVRRYYEELRACRENIERASQFF